MKKYYTESRGKLKGRRGGRLQHLVDDFKEGRKYWSEEEALEPTLWRTRLVGN
jgi:hypothetical protein